MSATNYALTVTVFVGAKGIDLDFSYDRSRFDEEQVRQLRGAFVRLLEALSADAECPLGALVRRTRRSVRCSSA